MKGSDSDIGVSSQGAAIDGVPGGIGITVAAPGGFRKGALRDAAPGWPVPDGSTMLVGNLNTGDNT